MKSINLDYLNTSRCNNYLNARIYILQFIPMMFDDNFLDNTNICKVYVPNSFVYISTSDINYYTNYYIFLTNYRT